MVNKKAMGNQNSASGSSYCERETTVWDPSKDKCVANLSSICNSKGVAFDATRNECFFDSSSFCDSMDYDLNNRKATATCSWDIQVAPIESGGETLTCTKGCSTTPFI